MIVRIVRLRYITYMNQKKQAKNLRKKGLSVNRIAEKLGVPQSSVSLWVRSVQLSNEQKAVLKSYSHSPLVIEKRRQSRLANESAKRITAINTSADDISHIDKKTLLILGTALYWAEGGKAKLGVARVTNTDPDLIRMTMRFFREVCGVSEDKFRAHIHIHSPEAVDSAEKYWSQISGIPLKFFYKTYTIKSKATKNRRFSLPYGTLEVAVNSIDLHLKILGWIEGLKRQSK